MKKTQPVWIVNCADTECDDLGYLAIAEAYATRRSAVQDMERWVAEDEEMYGYKAVWSEDRDMAVIDRNGRKLVYTLDRKELKP